MKGAFMRKLPILVLCFCFSLSAFADQVTELLSSMSQSLETIQNSIYKSDEARVYAVKKSVDTAKVVYETKSPIHRETQYALFTMLIRVRVSQDFFEFVRTEFNEAYVTRLYADYKTLLDFLGLDDAPYSKVLAGTLKEILVQVNAVIAVPSVSESLNEKLKNTLPAIGRALSLAEQGDRPSAFKEAGIVYHQIANLYGMLDQELTSSRGLYPLYLELVGVNEFLGSYAEADGR